MKLESLQYLIALSTLQEIGSSRLRAIIHFFPDPRDAWRASASELVRAKIPPAVADCIVEKRKKISPAFLLETMEHENIQAILSTDPLYPRLLLAIHAPPPLLYYRGTLKSQTPGLAVVGTRKISPYGKMCCQNLVSPLAQNRVTIISGLAMGIDAQAHESALRAAGLTWAVLAGGLDSASIFPRVNFGLAQRIIEAGGCLISEHPPRTPSLKQYFPLRNRIISGLSLGTLVIEAPEKSGAMITAYLALEQNREVFAVPGAITHQNSGGPNNLIKKGAIPVLSAQDILETLKIRQPLAPTQPAPALNDESQRIYDLIRGGHGQIDDLTSKTTLTIAALNQTLTLLEMAGKIRPLGGGRYEGIA